MFFFVFSFVWFFSTSYPKRKKNFEGKLQKFWHGLTMILHCDVDTVKWGSDRDEWGWDGLSPDVDLNNWNPVVFRIKPILITGALCIRLFSVPNIGVNKSQHFPILTWRERGDITFFCDLIGQYSPRVTLGMSLLTITKRLCMLVYNFHFLILNRTKDLIILVLEMTVTMEPVFCLGWIINCHIVSK